MITIGHHKNQLKYEKDNYELGKQDRQKNDKDMLMTSSDLSTLISRKSGDDPTLDIDEEMLKEMAAFSNRNTSSNIKGRTSNGVVFRKNVPKLQGGYIVQ